ncbi:MAG: hypothetical protein NT007_16950 [Candidatus Kapabacteria bacterium]|nr:hypothetical protein [Candidatus Kapabacteria bacterium]
MKKIGILYGLEQSFPPALIGRINETANGTVVAELIKIGGVRMDEKCPYDVIFDRVSHEVPFYRSYLKNAVLSGTIVVNNPFWSCADDNFFNSSLAEKVGIKVPRAIILPSKHLPHGTTSSTMRNLIYPLEWESIFDFIKFPALLKQNSKNGDYHAYKIYNSQEFFSAYDLTDTSVMILQENIEFDDYFRTYVLGKKKIRIMRYDPRMPQYMRYDEKHLELNEKLVKKIEEISFKLCQLIDFDFHVIEFSLKDDNLYTTDFLNIQPTAEKSYLHDENFEWLVANTAEMLIDHALAVRKVPGDYTWSKFFGS